MIGLLHEVQTGNCNGLDIRAHLRLTEFIPYQNRVTTKSLARCLFDYRFVYRDYDSWLGTFRGNDQCRISISTLKGGGSQEFTMFRK
jgi:hypothetical protein